MSILQLPISQTIWELKYRYQLPGKVIDQTIEDTWSRVAQSIAKVENKADRKQSELAFYDILSDFKFLPGGRILAGAGTKLKVTLFNCFVMDIKEDSLRGIFEALEEGALTLQQGGGVGYDFSVLRPNGDLVKKTGLSSSGPVSFMRIWDTTCSILLSTGARRGAMMGVLRCDHPDIEEFIDAKSNAKELRHFNVSVFISDAFMQAVENDHDWPLVFPLQENDVSDKIIYRQWGDSLTPVACKIYKYINARKLWDKIIHSAYEYAEPGVLFGDTINRFNNLYYCEQINATNPCGEIPLPAYGACNLGSINLTKFVLHPFTDKADIDWISLEEVTQTATRFQDNVIDASHFPLPAQRKQALGTRRIGLGITGLADLFVMLNIVYGSQQSIAIAEKIMQKIAHTTWMTSIELAREKGRFPFYKDDYLRGEFVTQLPDDIRKSLSIYGVRNSHHNTIAPAGTISLLANNISNGVEPIFKPEYNRHVRTADGKAKTFVVHSYSLHLWREGGATNLPPAFVDTDQLQPENHLQIQAVIQPYIDNAISKTINIPRDFPFTSLEKVYSKAYKLNLKGCTVFRPNPITGSVLEEKKEIEIPPVDSCCQFEE